MDPILSERRAQRERHRAAVAAKAEAKARIDELEPRLTQLAGEELDELERLVDVAYGEYTVAAWQLRDKVRARPTSTHVAGFRAWLALGYAVRRGERSHVRVWAPCPPPKKRLQAWRDAGADPRERPRTYFRLTPTRSWPTRPRSSSPSPSFSGPSARVPGLRLAAASVTVVTDVARLSRGS